MELYHGLFAHFVTLKEKLHFTYFTTALTQNLWNQVQTYISDNLVIPRLTLQGAMFGFVDTQQENRVIINHSLIILKFNAYKSRDLKTLNFLRLKSDIIDLKTN